MKVWGKSGSGRANDKDQSPGGRRKAGGRESTEAGVEQEGQSNG